KPLIYVFFFLDFSWAMEGLTDEEYRRLQKLQEICPEDDIFHLYVDAAPYLKFEETFNFFLNDLIEKKFKHKTENKGKIM
ncbi:hypothetical protein NL341_28470, partial [Klebsiella pneumoniae]|nr:hypothetical protein [Klebsiella pneumoniae]